MTLLISGIIVGAIQTVVPTTFLRCDTRLAHVLLSLLNYIEGLIVELIRVLSHLSRDLRAELARYLSPFDSDHDLSAGQIIK